VSLFPTTLTPGMPIINTMWSTNISTLKSGKENRTQNWVFPVRIIRVPFPNISLSEAKQIINFYNNDCKGARYSFHFKFPVSENYTKEFVGQGDAASKTFTLPITSGVDGTTTMYVDDVEDSARTFSSGTGTDSRDQITFTSAPSLAAVITVSFTGYWTPTLRFSDSMAFRYNLYDILSHEEIVLKEIRE